MPRKALIGNWFEEEAYQRDRKLLMQGRDGGVVETRSETARVMAKIKHHNTPHGIAPIESDGFLRFYAPVMLQNAATLGFLSLDLDERKLSPTGWRVVCTTSPSEGPTLRSCFFIIPAPTGPTDMIPIPPGEEDVLHYGQPFFVMTVPGLTDNPLSLVSEHKGPHSASRVTGKYQDVFFSPDGSCAEAMWVADFANPEYRVDMRDRPIKATDVLIIRHNHTNVPLASTQSCLLTDFGQEYEVCCGKFVEVATKLRGGHHQDENYWTFVHHEQGKETEAEPTEPPAPEAGHSNGEQAA